MSDTISHLLTLLFQNQILSYNENDLDPTYVYIRDHYKEDINLDFLAKERGYSKFFFIKQFKDKFNDTPVHFLNSYRAKRTLEMLSDKKVKIEDAAIINGFKDKRSFLRICKKIYGTYPSKLR